MVESPARDKIPTEVPWSTVPVVDMPSPAIDADLSSMGDAVLAVDVPRSAIDATPSSPCVSSFRVH